MKHLETFLINKTMKLFNFDGLKKPNIITSKSGKTMSACHHNSASLTKEERRKARSKTFPGIAKAMATQWL